jgi:hypothetical protein
MQPALNVLNRVPKAFDHDKLVLVIQSCVAVSGHLPIRLGHRQIGRQDPFAASHITLDRVRHPTAVRVIGE